MTKKIHPYIIIILSFVGVILLGTLMLMLPISSTSGKSFGFVDSWFMATSSVCVTGLTVMDMSVSMTVFGKVIMGILMEIGGLSFLTIAVFFFSILGAKIGVSNRFLLKEALNQSSIKGVVSLTTRIVTISLIIQGVGIFINMFSLMPYCDYNFWRALGYSTFHSIASFNNAGFDCYGPSSLIPFANDVILNASTILLIIFGGLGFVVIDDVIKSRRWKKFSLHTKITLIITVVLIVLGMFFIKITMNNVTWLQALFTSVTTRTAGFTTIDMSQLTPGAYIVIIVLMFIGASPCSTGGGIKTSTFAVVILAIVYFARGKKAKAFHRRIPSASIFKAFVLFTVAVIVVLIGTLAIAIIQPELGIQEILFEVVSAFSTTGLTMGITTSLNAANKIIICALMLFGRLGPLTVISVVNKNWMTESDEEIQYVEERVIIG